jgi:hypothetical protein
MCYTFNSLISVKYISIGIRKHTSDIFGLKTQIYKFFVPDQLQLKRSKTA